MDKTASLARGKWRGILAALGIDERFLKPEHGPCPKCGGTDRFRFDDKEGNGTFYCSHCGAGNGFGLLQMFHGWDFKQAAREVDMVLGNVQAEPIKDEVSEEKKIQMVKTALNEAFRLVPTDPAFRYLDSRCGVLDPTRCMDMRFHPGMYHPDAGKKLPCLLAILRYADGSGSTVHRTFLTREGQKADVLTPKRLMPGKTPMGAAVRLGGEYHTVCVAEGIETALCCTKRFELPGFAAISAEGMKAWEPPAYVKKVVICGDNDSSFTGQSAAYHLAWKLKGRGLEVEVQIPDVQDSDWCDLHHRA